MRATALTVVGFVLLAGCAGSVAETTDSEIPVVETTDSKTRLVEPRTTARSDREPDRAPPRRLAKPKPQQQPARRVVRRHRVLEVVDGDTVKVAYRGSEVSVRVIGIDTPETVHPSEPVECGGPQASATATRMLSGTRVRLVFDSSQGRTDAYDRTLAYLHTPGLGDFGLAMIRRGRAAEYTYDSSYARQGRYQAAQSTAQAAGRGIWDRCGGADRPLTRSEPGSPSAPSARPRGGGGVCDPGYDPCVPPYPPDLDCADVDGPIRVTGDDPHGFDADGDGFGCDA